MKIPKYTSWFHSIKNLVRTICAYFLVTLIFIIFFIPALVLMCLPEKYRRDNRVLFWFIDKTLRGFVWASLINIRFEGRENIPSTDACIFIANHESSLDIPILGSLAHGRPQVWFALDFYLKFPVLGFVIRRVAIPVTRHDTARSARALVTGVKLLVGKNRNLMIFPEGGRFTDGKVHPFFPGFAYIAFHAKRPVVPVYIHDAGKALPPDAFIPAYQYPVTVKIGEPFIMGSGEAIDAFTQRVHQWFEDRARDTFV